MRGRWNLFVVAVLALLASWPAGAAITYYYGLDAGAGPASPHPNSNAQAAAFDTAAGALGPMNLITFESLPVNVPTYATNLSLGGGVTALLAGAWDQPTSGITSTPGNSYYGFNVTLGGSKYLELNTERATPPLATATIQFPSAVQGFGVYIGGVGTGSTSSPIVVQFNDGSPQQYTLVGYYPTGGVMFFGFTDPGAQITSVTFQETDASRIDDSLSLDDIRYTTFGPPSGPSQASAIPALSTWGLAAMTLVLGGIATFALRRAVI